MIQLFQLRTKWRIGLHGVPKKKGHFLIADMCKTPKPICISLLNNKCIGDDTKAAVR